MFAATGMLFATSCSNDELEVVQSGNEAQVTFSLAAEGGIATRAISDGAGAKKLVYAVYNAKGELIKTIAKTDENGQIVDNSAFDNGLTENVTITLAKGQQYTVAFWAQNPNCTAYTTTDLKNVTIDYAGLNNDETRDAFFKAETFTVTGNTAIDVVLKRPFAQINVGVTKADWDAAVASGITIAQSSVVIKNAATNLNLLNGTVSGQAEVSYSLANIPSNPAILDVDTDGDGKEEKYNWLSMSYILPADNTTGYAKTTLDNVAFVFAPENSSYKNIEFNQGLNAVPVQRNWRTNILGKILTGDITFNIVIDPVYEDDHNVMVPYATINGVAYKSFAEAMAAVQNGETIKLEGETTLTANANEMLYTIENKAVTIDLNGYGIVANIPDVNKNTAIFQVKKNGTLTIQGEGNVKVVTADAVNVLAALISNEGGTVNLNGGNWTMTALEYPAALIPTFVDNNSTSGASTLNINGGTYTFHRNLFRNFSNNKTEVATINIYGGIFNGRESDEGAIWNQKPSAVIPDGAGVINIMGGTFNNVVINDEFNGVVYVNSQEEVAEALKNTNTHTIMLSAGNYTFPAISAEGVTLVCEEGTVFEGNSKLNINGATVIGATFSNPSGSAVDQTINGTFKDCTFTGVNGLRYCYAGETVVFENCVFDGSIYGVHFDGGANDVIFRNCTISGFNALGAALTLVTFEGCTFKGNGKSGYNGANLWGSAKMINCEFTFDGTTEAEWIDCIGADKTYEFTNCTVNGEKYTSDNFSTFTKIFSRNHVGIIINGIGCKL